MPTLFLPFSCQLHAGQCRARCLARRAAKSGQFPARAASVRFSFVSTRSCGARSGWQVSRVSRRSYASDGCRGAAWLLGTRHTLRRMSGAWRARVRRIPASGSDDVPLTTPQLWPKCGTALAATRFPVLRTYTTAFVCPNVPRSSTGPPLGGSRDETRGMARYPRRPRADSVNGASLELSDTESAEGIEVSRPLILSLPDHALGTDGARPSLPSRPGRAGTTS